MEVQTRSRKRPAPGTSPSTVHINTPTMYDEASKVTDMPQLSNDQFLAYGDFSPAPSHNLQSDGWLPAIRHDGHEQSTEPTNQLVRRNTNQQLATRASNFTPLNPTLWPSSGEVITRPWQEQGDEEDERDMERRAVAAKKFAQSRRPPKTIPPFIQKLRSFLEGRYDDLIRWADGGNSFIVIDEDEFAKTLIPLMFKHKNYASFVRQLNMYGFHKKVGLSDNSMSASQKKGKTPSEYSNPYFKRDRKELQWLIQKPEKEMISSKKKGKLKQSDQDQESEDDMKPEADGVTESKDAGNANPDVVTLTKEEHASMKREIAELQRSQKQIAAMLGRLRDDNNQYIRQAGNMLAQHERHENSINAILQFLATFYKRSMDDNGNISNMFPHAIPTNQPQGSVVDLGNYVGSSFDHIEEQASSPRQTRRPLAILAAPTASSDNAVLGEIDQSRPPSLVAHRNPTPSLPHRPLHHNESRRTANNQAYGVPFTTLDDNNPLEAANSVSSFNPTHLSAHEDSDIMNLIHNANANSSTSSPTSAFDFNSALQHYETANGNAPLTPEQRDSMLSLMATHSGTTTPAVNSHNSSNNLIVGSRNNKNMQLQSDYFKHFNSNREELEALRRLQEQLDTRMQNLTARLQPLSPSGSIPGLEQGDGVGAGGVNAYGDPMADLDLHNYLNSDYFPGLDANDLTDISLDFGDPPEAQGGIGEAPQNYGSAANSLFGDAAVDTPPAGADAVQDDSSGDGEGRDRMVESVGTNSEVHSPAASAIKEKEDNLDGDARPRSSKKRKTAR